MNKKIEFFEQLKNRILSGCSKCKSTGWISDKDGDIPCECLRRFETCVELDDAGIDLEYWDLTFDNWRGDAVAKKKTLEYVENLDSAYANGLGIVFYGTNGVGKTLLSCLILKSALKKGKSIRFITMAETIQKMKQRIDNPDDSAFYEEKVKNVEFLVLDNLGAEYRPQNFSSYTLAEFDILSRHRRRHFLPTILTTNLTHEEFLKNYGSSISSLFSACSQFISVNGVDFRAEQGKQYLEKLRGTI